MKLRISLLLLFMFLLTPFLIIQTNAIDTSEVQIKIGDKKEIIIEGADYYQTSNEVANSKKQQTTEMNEKYESFLKVINFITGIAAVTMFGIFIKNILHFSTLGTEHWILKRQAMFGLLWTGIATALLGSATLIMALSYTAFQF